MDAHVNMKMPRANWGVRVGLGSLVYLLTKPAHRSASSSPWFMVKRQSFGQPHSSLDLHISPSDNSSPK